MNKVLVATPAAEELEPIVAALSTSAVVRHAATLQEAVAIHHRSPFDVIFVDLEIPEVAAALDTFASVLQPFKSNAPNVQFIVLTRPVALPRVFAAVREHVAVLLPRPVKEIDVREAFKSAQAAAVKDLELDYLRDRFWKTEWLDIVRSEDPGMQQVFQLIRTVAPTVATVLLLGETGTGKGLLARLVHVHSHRADKPFMAVHCGAIPDTLIESELFGHEKGAFTGADRRKIGKFEIADQGTIFLDEIGTVTAAAQIKLLQVLQDGTFSRVGGEKLLKTDARIIAATNADLSDLVARGQFRKDLYYRLNIFPVQIPPLRERLADLPHLVDIFLKKLDERYGKGIRRIQPGVAEGLKAYDWPGNIRELENLLERAYILESRPELGAECFPADLLIRPPRLDRKENNGDLTLAQARQIATEEFEQSYLRDLMNRCQGRINLASEKAGITTRQLSRLLARHGIRKADFKKPN